MKNQDAESMVTLVNFRRFLLLILGAVCIMNGLVVSAAESSDAAGPTVLITGSNRGIGLEFARQYAALDWHVIATCRHPDQADALQEIAAKYSNVTVRRLDLTDHAGIVTLASWLDGLQ